MLSVEKQIKIAETKNVQIKIGEKIISSFLLGAHLCESIVKHPLHREPNLIAMMGTVTFMAKKNQPTEFTIDLAKFIHHRYRVQIGIFPVARLLSALNGKDLT